MPQNVALVHDYLNEYGGAERVLEVLAWMFPQAPIYTAFMVEGSSAWRIFKDKQIIESSLAPLLKWHKLYSPLRFLAPWVWEGFDFKDYDVVISSASWYITKGILTSPDTHHICYCHTPPRYLYGYPTSIEWQRYWPIRLYAKLVNGWLRRYDYIAAQRPDVMVVNSDNVARRVKKFYGRDSTVIYPPVQVEAVMKALKHENMKAKKQESKIPSREGQAESRGVLSDNYQTIKPSNHLTIQPSSIINASNTKYQIPDTKYFLIVSRVVGSKGIEIAMHATHRLGVRLKIVGEKAGLRWQDRALERIATDRIEFVGRVSDTDLWQLYAGATAFLALAEDEDFGMTVVESQAAGTPIIAYYGGGYKETVIEGETGIFFKEYSVEALVEVMRNFDRSKFKIEAMQKHARKFSKEVFVKKMQMLIDPKSKLQGIITTIT